jgi:plastocyanin
MNGRGFLGTNASLLADLSLTLGVLVALTLTAGVILALLKRYQLHRWVQSIAVAINLAQVLAIMVASFLKSAVPGLPQRIGEPYYLAAAAHALLGLGTLAFGTFVALRANGLVPRALQFSNYRLFMRTAYGLYMLATVLGMWVYSAWYINPAQPAAAEQQAQPVARRAGEVTVPMANFAFTPKELVVPVGTTVIWVNRDGAPHNAVADDGQLFRSDLLSRGQQFRHTFAAVGEFAYYCEVHGGAGGQDMAGVVKVVPADQAPALAAGVPEPAAPTPQPTPGSLPAALFGQPSGTAAFRDARGRSDQVVINLRAPAPPAGESLYAFLTTLDGGASQPLGALATDANGAATVTFTAPDGSNLAARFNRLVISREPAGGHPDTPSGQPMFEGRLPSQAFGALNQLLADGPGLPARQGYAAGTRAQTDELARHAKLVADARAAGDLAGIRRHAEHIYNLIAGSLDPRFGDLNGDGRSQNPGDGFGLLPNGSQDGYLRAMGQAATTAKGAADATDAIKAHATHVFICVQNMQSWSTEARGLALALTRVSDAAAAEQPSGRLALLIQSIRRGSDANGDGEIAPIPGEGGALVAYEHAQFMAGFGLFPASTSAGAAPGNLAIQIYPVVLSN